MDIKETLELLRAVSAVTIETIAALKDGKHGLGDKIKLATMYPMISEGLSGLSQVPKELMDLDQAELNVLLAEITESLIKAGFTHRLAEMADRILRLAFHNVVEVVELKNLPPTAIPV